MDYPAGLETAEHAHQRAQLLYAVSGVMRITTPEASYLVPPSMALFLPSGALHAIRMEGPVAMRALILQERAARKAADQTKVIAITALLKELVLAACAEPLRWKLDGRGHHLTALALDEIRRATAVPLALALPKDDRLRRAIALMQDRNGRGGSLEDLAIRAGASSRTLARCFMGETGMTFRQWRRHARMTEAMSALSTGATPARAAAVAGYSGQAAFGAAFRSVFGMTPGEVRRRGLTAGSPEDRPTDRR
jgi:AraC-like DNA-binding protein